MQKHFFFVPGDSYRVTRSFESILTNYYPSKRIQGHDLYPVVILERADKVESLLYEVNPVMSGLKQEDVGTLIYGKPPEHPSQQKAWDTFLEYWATFAQDAAVHITRTRRFAKHGAPRGANLRNTVTRLLRFEGMLLTRRATLEYNKLLPKKGTD